ncbi:MAG: polysaccharide deacetylase family protein [Janthinobacterium lividum]
MRAAAGGTVLGASLAIGTAYWAGFGPRTQMWGAFPYRASAATDVASSPREGLGAERVVALTFDDGPNEPWTGRLLDVLAAKGVRATFFQVGRCAERFPSTTRRVVDEGHVLGNHSLNHAFTSYLRDPHQRDEVARAQEVLHRVAGVVPGLYRPPWLCHWPWVLRTVEGAGLQVVSGTFGYPLEVFQPAAPRMTAGAARRIRPGSILIMHDGREARGGDRSQTVASVGPLIDRLRVDGYTFATVDELLGVPAHLG